MAQMHQQNALSMIVVGDLQGLALVKVFLLDMCLEIM